MPRPIDDPGVARLRRTFRQLESFIPADEPYLEFLQEQRPDLLLVSPLVNFGGRQAEFVKAARELGVPSAVLVFSWDNLTNKGLMHEVPDRVFVWNEIQRREAIELHGAAPDRVVAVGAPRFDAFYRMQPSRSRAALCESHRLDPTQALLVYLGSSPTVAPHEPRFVQRWLEALRRSADQRSREAQVLIRPHPRHRAVWEAFEPARTGDGVSLTASKSAQADQTLLDVLAHADAAVGLNTSAELEAGILGTPVYTVDAGALVPGQAGSAHYKYLLATEGGFVEHATSLGHHLEQLAAGLAGQVDDARRAAFIERFVRPLGANRAVSPMLADMLVDFATTARPSWLERTTGTAQRQLDRLRRRTPKPRRET